MRNRDCAKFMIFSPRLRVFSPLADFSLFTIFKTPLQAGSLTETTAPIFLNFPIKAFYVSREAVKSLLFTTAENAKLQTQLLHCLKRFIFVALRIVWLASRNVLILTSRLTHLAAD